jgi:hypothetical protein
MALLTSLEFYRRHTSEFNKYIHQDDEVLIITPIGTSLDLREKLNLNILDFDLKKDIDSQINTLSNKYDLIILSDVLEVSQDIIRFLNLLRKNLNKDGRILIASINPIWNIPLKLFENLKLKKESENRSYIHLKKFSKVLSSVGLEVLSSTSRQYFPFKLLYLGSIINKFLEIMFHFLNFGIRTYILVREDNSNTKKTNYSKTIIIPAKNEEGNLVELIDRIPNLGKNTEVVISCGTSHDNTLKVAKGITSNFFDIKVIEQTKDGKANAVWEAIESTDGEIIAILDADISVDPEKLEDFFEIISLERADFVNGTRLIYDMERGAMKFINNIGNRVFQFIVSLTIGLPLTDSLCGTKVFRRTLYTKIISWQSTVKTKDPFGDFDLLFAAAYSGHKILELPIHYKTRTYGETQINKYRDGYKLIKYLVRSFYKFNSSS